jgi:hypothetical protein
VKINNTRIFTVTAGFFLTALLIVSSMQLSQFFINNAKASTGDNIGPVNYGDVNQYEWPMWKGSETWACFNPEPAPNKLQAHIFLNV